MHEKDGRTPRAELRFAPKCIAICIKTQCYLLQNAVLNGAKRSANSYKTQG